MDMYWKAEVSKNVGGSLSILRALIVSCKTHDMPQDIRGRAEGSLHLSPLQNGMVELHIAYSCKSCLRPIFSTRLTLVLPCSVLSLSRPCQFSCVRSWRKVLFADAEARYDPQDPAGATPSPKKHLSCPHLVFLKHLVSHIASRF